jgi:hypothetical protein
MLADKIHTNVRSGKTKLSSGFDSSECDPDLAANWVRSRSRITSGISSFSRHLPWSPRCQRHHCWIDQYSARNCCREHIREPNRRLFRQPWSDGRSTFDTPAGVSRFALICLIPSTMTSATLGVGSLSLGGYADWSEFRAIWTTWWMGDVAGALVITPAIGE